MLFLARFLPLEETFGVPGESEKMHALVHVGLVCRLAPFVDSKVFGLLGPSVGRYAVERNFIYAFVQLADMHRG